MKRSQLMAAFGLAMASPAAAHIVLAPQTAPAGSYYFGDIRVGHGCGASATTAIRIEIPEGVMTARPQPKSGWTISIERKALARPIAQEGRAVTDRVSAISWTGGPLPADQFDTFGLMLKLPGDDVLGGGVLAFPIIQKCVEGESRWIETPKADGDWRALKHPAARLEVEAPTPEAAHHHH